MSAMASSVDVKCHYPSGTIVLNRPDKRNALSRDLIRQLQQAFDDLHQERRVRAVMLTGNGTAFCAGMDLDEMKETALQENSQEMWFHDAREYQELIETMLRFPKPIIAAMNGSAVAGGAGLVLASDIVLAAPKAKFGFPEPRRGIVAGIVSPLLAFRTNAAIASRLLLTAELVLAESLTDCGLVHEIVEHDLLWARGHDLAQCVSNSAPQAIQLTKQLLNETIGQSLFTQLAAGAAASAAARTTDVAAEGIDAFLEKREPQWP